MKEAELTSTKINQNRELYRTVAIRGSVLYFVIADLALIDPMYQYSLEYFIKLFKLRLTKAKKSEKFEERLQYLIEDITENVYVNICRGLFEKDKLIYSFLNTTSILRNSGKIDVSEWNIFLRGSLHDYSQETSPEAFIDNATWQKIMALEEAHYHFRDIGKTFKNKDYIQIWKQFYNSDNPQDEELPGEMQQTLSTFQKLMIIKVMREEKLIISVKKFVKEILGDKFIESPPFDLI